MKGKFIRVLIALVLVLSLNMVMAAPAGAATINVPGDQTTIQDAIDAAIAGDTITVDAGTYAENVVVDKALTLQGAAGATIAPTTGVGVEIQASTVTVSGFTINTLGTNAHGIWISVEATNLAITGNDITIGGFSTAIYADAGASQSAKSSGWTISGNTLSAAAGVNMELYDVDAVTIDNNTFMNALGSNIIISSELFDLTGPIVFTNNDVQGNDGGSMVAFVTDFQQLLTLTRSDTTATTMDGVTITGNTFDGWAARGLRLGDWGGDVTNVVVNNNDFLSTGAALVNNDAVALDAQFNWWGDASGPSGEGSGTGGSVSTDADYSPWEGAVTGTSPMTWYTDDTIQTAITAATAGDTIVAKDGTFTEDLTVNTADLTLRSQNGKAVTTIQLVDGVGIDIQGGADNFKLGGASGQGFTISPHPTATTFDIQLANAPSGVEISYNTIDTTGTVGQGISIGAAGASGLTVSNNTFTAQTNLGGGSDGSIWGPKINDVTVSNNTFTGTASPDGGYAVEFAGVTGTSTISGNTITNYGMGVAIFNGEGTSGLTISGNTISGSVTGIRLGQYSPTTNGDMTTVTVTNNTLSTNTDALQINDGVNVLASNFTINYNAFTDSTGYGIENQHSTEQVTAEWNWWGDVAGPTHTKNPYIGPTNGDTASDDVDYLPWMIHTSLVSGWNIYSTPIASGTSTDTISEALNFWGTGTATAAYYFDGSSQAWAVATSLTPLVPVYLNMSAAATIDTLMSTSNTAPPAMTMYQGWNLVGPAQMYTMGSDYALISAYWGTGAANLVGYSQAVSPGINQTYTWTFIRDVDESIRGMYPTEGYWVYMVNQGTLGGFSYTPITPLP